MKKLVCVVLALCAIACDDQPTTGNAADAAAMDAASNPEADAGADAESDPEPDAALDAAGNLERDAAMDATGNPEPDAAMDATSNSEPDAAMDAAGNPEPDAGPDATSQDGAPTDAAPADAAPAVATHTGTISILDVRLRNMGGVGIDGHGVQIGISFVDDSTVVAPVMQESTSAVDGCKLWELTPSQLAASVGGDEGPVQITASDGEPVFPACIFAGAGVGYLCPDTASSGVGGTLSASGAPPGTSLFTPAGAATFGAEDIGRYLRLGATGVNGLNTSFPIVAVVNATTIVLATGASISLTLPGAATFTTFAGAGPMPGAMPDTFFTNTERVTIAKTASTNFEAFPANTGFPGSNGIGDGFTLGTADSKVLPTTIPTDGSAFTLGCDDAPSCGTALGTIVDIVTTDAPLGASPFSFPSPTTRRVQIRCIKVGARSVTVPAEYAARLAPAMSGATRMRVQFIRANMAGAQNVTTPPNVTNIAGGHAEVGFVTLPQ